MRHAIFLAVSLVSPLYCLDTGSTSLGNSSTITTIPQPHDLESGHVHSEHDHHHRRQSHFKIKMAAVTTLGTGLIAAGVTLGLHYMKCNQTQE